MTSLRLVSDDYGRALSFNGIRIIAGSEDAPPFPVDAVAVEEDTNLLLSAEAGIREPTESFGRLIEDMAAFEPGTPGSVRVRGTAPVHLLAIVHDIERSPTWCEAWVESALSAVLFESERRRLATLRLPVLGARHGDITTEAFAALLRRALENRPPRRLKKIWLPLPENQAPRLLDTFR